MSRFTKDEQTEIVRWAMNLEATIQSEKSELSRLMKEKFKPAPSAPERKTVNMNIKPVAPDYSSLPKINYTFTNYLEDEIKTNPTFINKMFSSHPFKRGAILFGVLLILTFVISSITSLFSIGMLFGVLAFFTLPATGVYWLIKQTPYSNKKRELEAQLKQTPEYINAKKQADMLAQQQQEKMERDLQAKQAAFDAEYKKAKDHYDMVVIPQYNDELEKWNTAHDLKIRVVTDDLNTNTRILTELYDETSLISKNNRTLQKLTWLYEDMSTSEHDIERATDLLNANQQLAATRNITSSINNMHNDVMSGMYAIYSEIEAGNDSMDAMLDELGKMRRDINIGTGVRTIQQHRTNKQLKNFSKEFEDLRKKFN